MTGLNTGQNSVVPLARLAANARQFARTGMYDEAVAVWREVRALYPEYPSAWGEAVYVALDAENLELAARLAEEAIEAAPQFLDSWAGWAQIPTHKCDWRAAIDRWQEAGRRFPAAALPPARLGEAWLALGMVGNATVACIRALGLERGEQTALATLTAIYLQENKFADAASLCGSAIASWPDNPDFYVKLGQAYVALGEFEKADGACLAGMTRAEENPALYVLHAQISGARNNLKQAAGRWLAMRRKFPGDVIGYSEGVRNALSQNDWKQAAAICRQALSHAPQALIGLRLPATCKEEFLAWAKEPMVIKHETETLARLKIFRLLYPGEVAGYLEAARIYAAQQRHHKAEEICMEGLARAKPDYDLLVELVRSCARQDRRIEAGNFASIACCLCSGDRAYVENTIYVLITQGCASQARELYDKYKNMLDVDAGGARLRFAMRLDANPDNALKLLSDCVDECEPYFRPT